MSKSSFYRLVRRLQDDLPGLLIEEEADRARVDLGDAVFLLVPLMASPAEIELPNGGVERLHLGVGQVVPVEVIQAAGVLRPWKAPN